MADEIQAKSSTPISEGNEGAKAEAPSYLEQLDSKKKELLDIEERIDRKSKELKREAEAIANAGRGFAIKAPEISPEEKRKQEAKTFFKGTDVERALEKYG